MQLYTETSELEYTTETKFSADERALSILRKHGKVFRISSVIKPTVASLIINQNRDNNPSFTEGKSDPVAWNTIESSATNNNANSTKEDLIAWSTLSRLIDRKMVRHLTRGVAMINDEPNSEYLDLSIVGTRIPNGVICLVSSLYFHDLTTEIPHAVYVALGKTKRYPKIDFPPVRVFRFSGLAQSDGIEHHKIDDVDVKIYSVAKTIVDCFKFRNKIGLSIAMNALKEGLKSRKTTRSEIVKYAAMLRMYNVMKPYLQAFS